MIVMKLLDKFASRFWLKLILAVIVLLNITNCATRVSSKVSTYRNDANILTPSLIVVKPEDSVAGDSLEFRFFKSKLEGKLVELGYQIAQSPDDAVYVAYLGYGVEQLESEQRGGRVFISGGLGRAYRSGFGQVFVTNAGHVQDQYSRFITFRIDANRPTQEDDIYAHKIVQVTATSEGNCELLAPVYDEMLEAIFQKIDRPNGSIQSVTVPGKAVCR